MADFYITLPTEDIATQVAKLLNLQNKLYKKHNAYSVMNNVAVYFIEVEGDRVIGCTGLLKEEESLSKSYHTSVLPGTQRRGIATKLMRTAMDNCKTRYIYGTIREDNVPSLRLVQKLGWLMIRKDWSRDHWVITMARNLQSYKHEGGGR